MATSGSFTGARGGSGTGPYLKITWQRLDVDVSGNRSLLRIWLTLVSDYALNFSSSKTGRLHNTDFTYTEGFSGTGSKDLKVIDTWVSHGDDGKLTQNIGAHFNIAVTYGSYIATLYVSGDAVLDDIPRASPISMDRTAFTMGEQVIIYTNKKANFTHTLTYIFGNTTINIAFGVVDSFTWTVPLDMANVIPSATAGIGTMVCSTYDGGTLIGQTTVGFTVHVPASVVPSASGLSVAIAGNGRDKTLGKYIQSISKVMASFSAAGAYSSTVTYTGIVVRRKSDAGDGQTIPGTSGTTSNPVVLSGVYEIIAEVWDSRGRYNNQTLTITVDAYSAPSISKFTASRSSILTSSVLATIIASWSMGANNPATVIAKGKNSAGTEVTLYTLNNSTAGAINTSPTWTNQSDASSYTYTLTVTDSFGNTSTAVVTVGTTFVEMSISKGKGVGIGKVHERGSLDVAGDAYISGKVKEGTADLIPSGVIQMFGGGSTPDGWLSCMGQAVSRTTYAKLFTAIGTLYGAGDGSTTFNLPDFQGRVPGGASGRDVEFSSPGKTGGSKTVTLTKDQMPSHGHSVFEDGGKNVGRYGGADPGSNGYQFQGLGRSTTFFTNEVGGGQAHNNLQPFLTVSFIIKV